MGIPSSTNPHASAAQIEPGELIYHITRAEAWQAALPTGFYRGDTLDREGFIHCSRRHQVAATANRYFTGQRGLVLLEIDPQKLGSPLILEALIPGEAFPHLYGALETAAVVRALPFEPGRDGLFSFPV